jgi:8-amino-7-oxononanoate synthase
VDEAHATGCFGPRGAGLVDELGLRDKVLATVHTGGKALGLFGAYVCGGRVLKDLLINRCRHLIFTTALPPAVAQWWLEMLPRVQAGDDLRRRLHQNARFFRERVALHGCTPLGRDFIVPMVMGEDRKALAAAEALQAQGYDIRAIRPPTVPPGTARLRVSIHADHATGTLEELAAATKAASRAASAPGD